MSPPRSVPFLLALAVIGCGAPTPTTFTASLPRVAAPAQAELVLAAADCPKQSGSKSGDVWRSVVTWHRNFPNRGVGVYRVTWFYGGVRLGCWINAVPAGGMVLVPDATTGCKCSYLNQAWFALQPRD